MSRTLKQWEAYLSKQMPRVRLLSELGLNYEDMLEIANLIKGENKRNDNLRQTTRRVVKEFPCTFVAFLAAFAAQNTEKKFWEALGSLIGVSAGDLNNANWRKSFLETLEKFKKTTFEDVGGETNKYVTSIRIHGGIPSYSLRDFFANMLVPSIEKPEYIELKGAELRDALLARSVVQIFTDSTVRNFFENTEEIGVQYLESCREVARSYLSSRQIPPLHGLPNYVVEKLTNFLEYQEDEKRGLRRPRIKFDPEGDGLILELPEEPISGVDVRGGQVRWQVIQNQKILKENFTRILRSGRDVHSEEQIIPLGYQIEPFQVKFSLPNPDGGFNKIREWMFEIRTQDAPNLLAFRSEDGSLLRWNQSLPAHDLLLVHPKDISLEFEGDARLIHSPDMYAEGWHKWRAEYRSLAGAFSLSLLQSGETLSTISIQKQFELPRLIGNIFTPNLDPKPLYLGRAPKLRIPLRLGVDPVEELKHWRIEINSAWEAEPFVRQEFKLSEKVGSITLEESAFEFDLDTILGDEPKGTYTLRVRGPLETDVEFPFRVWTFLQINDLPEYILPSEDSKVILNFSLPPARATLEGQAGVQGINITGQAGHFVVELDESVSELNLNLSWAREDTVIHVPFSIPIPRIKWRLVMGEESKVEWSNRSLRKPADAFLQSPQTPSLLFQLPGIEEYKNLTLRLIDPENPTRVLQEFTAQTSVLGSGHARFLLAAKDTIAQNRDVSVFEFQLLPVNKEGLYQPVSLLSLTREIDVSNVRIEQTEENLFLLWDEPSPLKNRRVFIRSMWKVWVDAWNIKIPDDARGKFDLFTVGSLPPSWYEIHFYVAPSWEQDIQSAPEQLTFVVKMISPEEQIAWLGGNLQKKPDTAFVNHFERACIYATIGESAKRDAEIQTCYSQVDQAKHKDLFAFHEWLDKYDANTRSAVRMKMYSPEQLQKLFSVYKPGEEFRRKYHAYILTTKTLRPDSAILLLDNETEPALVFHALRELIKRQDTRFIGIVKKMVSAGSLSDSDAIKLLSIDEQHSLSELDASEPEPVTSRLLSGLLRNKDELLVTLSNEKIYSLAKVELDPNTVNKYLGILIERQDQQGIAFVMELFQNGRLRGDEVTDLLGKNPRFSAQFLSNAPQAHAHSIQISELAQKFPIETGFILAGMFIKTRAGWCRVDTIEDISGAKLTHASKENTEIRLQVTLHPDTSYSMMGVIHMEDKKLNLINPGKYYQCGRCGFVANDHNIILRQHTREAHDGIGGSFAPISTRVSTGDNLEFSLSLPK